MLSIFEKLVQFAAQLVFSIMVWRAVSKDSPVWFFAAILYHTVISGLTTLLSGLGWTFWQVEGVLALTLLLNIWLLYWFWGDEGGLDSEGEDEDEDDEDDEDEEDEEDEEDVKPVRTPRKKSAAAIAASMKERSGAKPAAKKSTATKKAPVKKKAE